MVTSVGMVGDRRITTRLKGKVCVRAAMMYCLETRTVYCPRVVRQNWSWQLNLKKMTVLLIMTRVERYEMNTSK